MHMWKGEGHSVRRHCDRPVRPLVLVPAGQFWQIVPSEGRYLFTGHAECSRASRRVIAA